MDLTKLSDEDLKALADNKFSAISDRGLRILAGETPPEPKEGVLAAGVGGFKRAVSTMGTGLEALLSPEEAAKRGLARSEAIGQEYAPGASLDAVKKAYAERGLLGGAGEVISQIPTALAEQAPQIAATLGSAKLGAMAGTAVMPGVGTLIGGGLGAVAPSLLQLFGSNIERQAAEGAPEISRSAAAAAAVPGAALEAAATFVPLGKTIVGKLLGPAAEEYFKRGATEATEAAARESLKKVVAKGAAVGAAVEIPTEITQQMLERAQAGLPLTTDDALAEYGEAAYGAGLVGAPFGAAGRAAQRSVARGEVEAKEEEVRVEERKKAAEAAKAEQARMLTPEYRQELNAEMVEKKDQLRQIEDLLKDKTLDEDVLAEAKEVAKTLRSELNDLTTKMKTSLKESGAAPTVEGALARKQAQAAQEQTVTDEFGNAVKPKGKPLTAEEEAEGYERQAEKTLAGFREREESLERLREKERQEQVKKDEELQRGVQTFLQQTEELAELEPGAAVATRKLAEERRTKADQEAAQEMTFNRIQLVLEKFGLRAAGVPQEQRLDIESKINEGRIDRSVTNVLGIKGLGGRTVAAADALPNIQSRIQELEERRQKATTSKDPLMLDNGQLTEKGYDLVATEAKLNELRRLETVAQAQAPAETSTEAGVVGQLQAASAAQAEDLAVPEAQGLPKSAYPGRIETANKAAGRAFTDMMAYLDDVRAGRFFGEGSAPGQIGLASSTREGLLNESDALRKTVVDAVIQEAAFMRGQQGLRPLTRDEAIGLGIKVDEILQEILTRSVALPRRASLKEVVIQPAQTRGSEIIQSAKTAIVDPRPLAERQFGNPRRAVEVLAEAIKQAKEQTVAEGKRTVRADRPVLRQQFQGYAPAESRFAQGDRLVEQVAQILRMPDVDPAFAKTLDDAATLIANEDVNPTFLNTVDEQVGRILRGTDKPDTSAALIKDIQQDLDEQRALRAFVEDTGAQVEMFPETKATVRATPAQFQRLQKSAKVEKERKAVSKEKAEADQLRKELLQAKREVDAETAAIDDKVAAKERDILKKINDAILEMAGPETKGGFSEKKGEVDRAVQFLMRDEQASAAKLAAADKEIQAEINELNKMRERAAQAKRGSLEQRLAAAEAQKQRGMIAVAKAALKEAKAKSDKAKREREERIQRGARLEGQRFIKKSNEEILRELLAARKAKKPGEKIKRPSLYKIVPVKNQADLEEDLRQQHLDEIKGRRARAMTPGEVMLKTKNEEDQARREARDATTRLNKFTKDVQTGKEPQDFDKYKELSRAVEAARAKLKDLRDNIKLMKAVDYDPENVPRNSPIRTTSGPVKPTERTYTTDQMFDLMGERGRMTGGRSFSVDDVPDLRVGDTEPTGEIDVAAAKKYLAEVKKKANERGIKFNYYPLTEVMPPAIRQAIDALGPYAKYAKGGVMPNGDVFVIIDGHSTLKELEGTVAHELIGHVGFEGFVGEQGMKDLLKKVEATFGNVFKMADAIGVGRQAEDAAVALWKVGADNDRAKLQALREAIAYTMEKRVDQSFLDKARRWMKELVGAFRAGLKRLGLADTAKMTTSDLFYLMKQADANFKANKPIATMTSDGYASFSVKNVDNSGITGVIAQRGTSFDKAKSFGLGMIGLAGRVQFLDRFAALDKLVKRGVSQGIISSLKAMDVMYFNRMADQRNNFVAQFATSGVGKIVSKDGELMYDGGDGPSLREVSEALSKSGIPSDKVEAEFTGYLVALRASRVGVNKLDFTGKKVTEQQVKETIAKYSGKDAASVAFNKARELYQQYNDNLVDFVVSSGAMSKEKGAELKSFKDYVPFYRQRGDEVVMEVLGEGYVRIGDLKNQPYLQELVGGKTEILPVFTSALNNTSTLVDMALKNMATRNTAYVMQDLGVAKVYEKAGPASPNVIRFKRNGKEYHATINQEAMETLFGDIPTELVVQGMEGIKAVIPAGVRLLGLPANWLRKFVTRDPRYAIRQIFRDSMSAVMTTGANFVPVVQTLKDMTTMKKSGAMETLQKRGVLGGQVIVGATDDMSKIMQQIASGKPGWDMAMAKLDEFAMMGDAATRVSMYNSFLKQGLSEREATFATLEAMNFSRRGVSPTVLYANTLIPFFNAGLQGLDVLYRAYKGDMPASERLKVKQKLLARGTMMALMTLAYAAMMEEDETYENANPEERYGNWFVPTPFGTFRVPIPFELGLIFKALPEGVYRAMATDDKASDVVKALVSMAERSIPIDIPTAIKPAIELALNKSFFMEREIVDPSMEGIDVQYQYRPKTPEVIKLFGQIGLSPLQVEYALRGYTGSLLVSSLRLLDPVLGGELMKPGQKLPDFPVLGGLFQPKDATGIINSAYATAQQLQNAQRTYARLKVEDPEEAKDFYAESRSDIEGARAAGRFRQRMGEFTKQERMVRAQKSLTNDEKAERLDKLRQEKIKYAKAFKAAVDERRERQAAQP